MRYYTTIIPLLLLVLVLAFSLAACGQADRPLPVETPTGDVIEEDTAVPDPQPPASSPTPLVSEIDEELAETYSETIRFGRALVAEELGIEAAMLTITAVAGVEWPDGCLGLGQPGEGCTEALVPGLRIHVSVNDQIYEIRTDLDGRQYRWSAIQ
jgi:hypothetical protein